MSGRAGTKSPMVYSPMVPVAGGEGGSIRHDDDGRPGRMNDEASPVVVIV